MGNSILSTKLAERSRSPESGSGPSKASQVSAAEEVGSTSTASDRMLSNVGRDKSLTDLPKQLLLKVFACLRPRELARAESVSKQWQNLACDTALWREHCSALHRPFADRWCNPESKAPEFKAAYVKTLQTEANLLAGRVTAKRMMLQSGYVSQVAWSPDGSTLLSIEQDDTARLWDPAKGKQKVVLEHKVLSADWSPDSSTLALVTPDRKARLWNVANGEEKVLVEHGDQLSHLDWSRDGKMLCSVAEDTVLVTAVTTGEEVIRIKHGAAVCRARLSPGGSMLASAADDGTARITDLTTGKSQPWGTADAVVSELLWSPDGSMLASHDPGMLVGTTRITAVATGKEVACVKSDDFLCDFAWSPDSSRLATASITGIVRFIDATTGKETICGEQFSKSFSKLAWTPDSSMLALTVLTDATAHIVDAITYKQKVCIRHGGPVWGLDWKPDGSMLASATNNPGVHIIDFAPVSPTET